MTSIKRLRLTLVLLAASLALGCGSGDSMSPSDASRLTIVSPAADEVMEGTFALEFSAPGAGKLIWSFDGVRSGIHFGDTFEGEAIAADLGGGAHLLEVLAVGFRDTTREERWVLVASEIPPGGGTRAPGFFARDLDGKPYNPASLSAGQVTLINFWASWCSPCMQEMPALQQIHETYAARGLQMIGMNIQETREVCEGTIDRYGLTYPICIDSTTVISRAYYGVRAIPTTLLIDGQGVIRTKFVGSEEFEIFSAALEPLLNP